MSGVTRGFTAVGAAIALGAGLVIAAPVAHSQDPDAITLNVMSLNDDTYGMGAVYWCNDADAPNNDNCIGYNPPKQTVDLDARKSIVATLFTSSSNPASFSATGACSVGTSQPDPSGPTESGPVQVQAGGDLYLTATGGGGQCVMTGTTSGGGSLVPGTYTYTVSLQAADQQVTSPVQTLQMPKRMKVGQRFRVKGVDPQVTNAGQQISWRVLPRSRDNCRLTELTSGAVVLRARSRGTCRIQATAPGVPGEWNRFVQQFSVPIR